MSLWNRITRLYGSVMASRWGYHVFGRILPSAFFLLGFLGGLSHFPDVGMLVTEPSVAGVLLIGAEALSRLLGLWLAVLFAIRKPPLGRPSSVRGAVVALSATYFGAFVIFFDTLGLRSPSPSDDPVLATAGLLLGVAATLMLAVSYTTLGRHMGIFPEVRGLVTSGPYRFLRHPIYVGYVMGGLGALLRTISVEALLIFLSYYALVAWRAKLEEAALEDYFGPVYREYRVRTLGLPLPWPRQHANQPRSDGAQISSMASPKL